MKNGLRSLRRSMRDATIAVAGRLRTAPRPPTCPEGFETGAPDFVGVGAQKAGTTWWFTLIASHPGVYHHRPAGKERHFFDRYWRDSADSATLHEYGRWFPRPPGALTGEWTPQYMADPWTPPLLHAAAPAAKLLVLLRDPVERYRSGLTHYLQRRVACTSDTANAAFLRGFYARQLTRLRAFFGVEHCLVLQYERCLQDPVLQLRRTYEFLDLDSDFVPRDSSRRVYETRGPKVSLDARLRAELVELYSPDVRQLLADVPEIDVALWPNFRHLASGRQVAPARGGEPPAG